MKRITTLDKVENGTVVHLLVNGIVGMRYDGRTVRVDRHCGFNGQVYVWKDFRQGKAKMHGSLLCEVADKPENHRF